MSLLVLMNSGVVQQLTGLKVSELFVSYEMSPVDHQLSLLVLMHSGGGSTADRIEDFRMVYFPMNMALGKVDIRKQKSGGWPDPPGDTRRTLFPATRTLTEETSATE